MKWISVKERLPEYGTVSIVYGSDSEQDGLPYQTIATYSYMNGWFVGETNTPPYNVTHWMPLPEPPEKQ